MGQVLPFDHLREVVAQRQAKGERAVLTNGIFDLLHFGHLRYLQAARALGDFLVVAVNSDDSTRALKGPARPLVAEDERAELLSGLACVDYVTIFRENTASAVIAALRPAIYAKGADYAGDANRTRDYRLTAEALRLVLAGDTADYPELARLATRLPEAPTVAGYGGSLALLRYLPGHSTTELIQRILSRYSTPDAT
ncbi:MAG: D-glycero-beta-D-manno-heptose 1-phosphate adenylyltransferase/ D-glycero-beta-D-manno-heptose-7-phosphate kinase [Ktedonobacterales bacterium]|jgi:D-beta-D-heptose 7-phosphate kinase/D-beta-D-heptose 1-phosphate adenosyltransferase|nr:MAG: D-glycero-beta-D-manno-heptose 1-phosphate adenylyltransferase/ D-glycero-beta-D-manno-heptose-7-phosphate kinase [Ktedonobacterales bacterium]